MSEKILDKSIFANALSRATSEKNITKNDLALLVHKDYHTIFQLFSASRFTSIATLIDICRVLEITPDELLSSYLNSDTYLVEDEYHQIIDMFPLLHEHEVSFLFEILEAFVNHRSN
jgi:DNA-binding Xre family transcriptional regulator